MDWRYGFVSVDDHAQEHPAVWTDRLSAKEWGESIPQVREAEDGTQYWTIGDQRLDMPGVASVGALMPDRAVDPRRWEDVPEAGWNPRARLEAMNAGEIDCSVLYPIVAGVAGQSFASLANLELQLACARAYNDWIIDEWACTSPRLVAQCITPRWPVEAIVSEVERALERGHKGVVFPAAPDLLGDFPNIDDPCYDPLWALCQERGVPIGFHAGSSATLKFPAYSGLRPGLSAAVSDLTGAASSIGPLANFLFSPIARKFPDLKVVFAETTLSWAAYVIEMADHQAERQRLHLEGLEVKPSEVFRRQCYLAGWYDRVAAGDDTRSYFGVERILWESNFPMVTSTWPAPQPEFVTQIGHVPPDDVERMLWRNAAELYRL
jgi:predicted TIM-barrel fold metal-dependent hydrolase